MNSLGRREKVRGVAGIEHAAKVVVRSSVTGTEMRLVVTIRRRQCCQQVLWCYIVVVERNRDWRICA